MEAFQLLAAAPPDGAAPFDAWTVSQAAAFGCLENALTARIVQLKNGDKTEALLAVGTAFVLGEDVPSKGRILLYSMAPAVAPTDGVGEEGDGAQDAASGAAVREAYARELKGPVSAACAVQGRLLLAVGTRLQLHTWTGADLSMVAFFDAFLYVATLHSVKNYVLVGDVRKSVHFLEWRQDGQKLALLGKDFESLEAFGAEFVISGSTLGLLVTDANKNAQILSYAPRVLESFKGQRLLCRSQFHVGAHVAKLARLQMLPAQGAEAAPAAQAARFAVLMGTLDGGLDLLAIQDELTFRRLQALQRLLVTAVAHAGGLNPKAFRAFQPGGEVHRPGPDNTVDCELLRSYHMVDVRGQVEMARQIGTTRKHILTNLRDLEVTTSFF